MYLLACLYSYTKSCLISILTNIILTKLARMASHHQNVYQGELLGLMEIHLILFAANKVRPNLGGSLAIYSDSLDVLTKVTSLLTNRFPMRCGHSDVLRNIMVNYSNLMFDCSYFHVRAHQDGRVGYNILSMPSQLNCLCDGDAKNVIWGLEGKEIPLQEEFPLEPVEVFIGGKKMTSDTGKILWFWAHRRLAKELYFKCKLLNPQQFEHNAPGMFGIWTCKQVMSIAGTNLN